MHELSIAQNIIEIVAEHAAKVNAGRVTEVVLDVGAVAGVIPETLEFAWEVSVKDTIVEGAILKINFIEAKAICLECKKEFKLDDIFSICEYCNSIRYDIIQGKELKVKSIKIE
jgi:hydrogenase nickel incorporation protein HypA/HybF